MSKDSTDDSSAKARRLKSRRATWQGDAPRSWWSRFLAPKTRHHRAPLSVTLETIVAMLVMFGVGWLVSPADPLLIGTGFGWVWVMPIVLALRYGTILGFGSGALLLLAWQFFYDRNGGGVFPQPFFLGGFVLVMLCGQFGDIWIGRLRHMQVANEFLAERLALLTKNQFLLRISHERLEQDLLAKPATLRDSLTRLRTIMLDQIHKTPGMLASDKLPGAQRFLDTAAQACQLEGAQVFPLHDGKLVAQATAGIGGWFDLNLDDPLVQYALNERALAHIQSPELQSIAETRYVICAPMLDSSGFLVGMLVVQKMPFLALTRDNLQFLLVLCAYYADGVRHADVTLAVLSHHPDCPYEFALDFARLAHLTRETQIASSLVALVFNSSELSQTLFEHVLRTRRALDVQWPVLRDGAHIAMTLMPLSGEGAIDGYVLRIEENMQGQFGVDFETAGIAVHSMQIPVHDPVEALGRFLKRCYGTV